MNTELKQSQFSIDVLVCW